MTLSRSTCTIDEGITSMRTTNAPHHASEPVYRLTSPIVENPEVFENLESINLIIMHYARPLAIFAWLLCIGLVLGRARGEQIGRAHV